MSVLKAQGIEAAYDGRTVAALADLDVAAGEAVGLVGPNGSGKSTLLRLFALLERPSAGSLSLNGAPVDDERSRDAARRDVTLALPQPWMFAGSVRDNVVRGLVARGVSAVERRSRGEQVIEALGLSDLTACDARRLSTGQTARVSLARALVLETPLLLLDEPFLHVDPDAMDRVLAAVRARMKSGAAVLIAGVRAEDLRGMTERVVEIRAPQD